MLTPNRNADEILASAAFDALLAATANPGQKMALPDPSLPSIITALIDRECTVFASDEALLAQLVETGARSESVQRADFVFCTAQELDEVMPKVKVGSDLYPDDGATLIISTKLDESGKVQLSGPGIETQINVGISGLNQSHWAQRANQIRYPTGFEMLIVDEATLIAVPRSTQVEVL